MKTVIGSVISTFRRRVHRGAVIVGTALVLGGALVFPAVQIAAAAPLNSGCGNNLTCLQTWGNTAIGKRITALNNLIVRTNNNHPHLTSAQKSAIVQDAQTNIQGLQALQQKIDADTTVSAARTDDKSIFTQFRIYLVVLPRDTMTLYQEHQAYVIAKFTADETTIANDIQAAQSQGKNVSAAQQLFSDFKTQVSSATTNNAGVMPIVSALTPSGYNADPTGTRNQIATARGDLQATRSDLKAAASDVKQIAADLK